jgi:hypothetical protein
LRFGLNFGGGNTARHIFLDSPHIAGNFIPFGFISFDCGFRREGGNFFASGVLNGVPQDPAQGVVPGGEADYVTRLRSLYNPGFSV